MRAFARIRLLSATLVFLLMSGLVVVLPPLPASAAEPGVTPVTPIPISPVTAKKPSMPKWTAPSVTLPSGGNGETTVGGSLARLGGPTPVGGLQISVTAETGTSGSVSSEAATAAGQIVQLNVLAQAAVSATGAKGVVFTAGAASPLGGPVKLAASYAGFGGAFGAGWGGRLRLVAMPGCAISTPSLPECQVQTEVPGWVNDPVASTVSAPVTLPVLGSSSSASMQSAAVSSEPQVFALTAGGSSEAGDFKASTLNQSATWTHGGSSGDFTTSVALKIPPVPGLSPSVSLDYSSGSVDGLTSAMNTQASVIGEGWSLGGMSFVERSYRPCKDDGGPAWSNDLCYVSDAPVSIVLNGQSSQLLVDGSGNWFAEDGALGWRVQRLTGTGNPDNGVHDRESFKVTTMDGTQYFFGYRARTASGGALKVPVFFHEDPWSNCYSAQGFQYSYCADQGYRWNLDYVVDRFGNTMTYNWSRFTAKYGVANNSAAVEYDLAADVTTIDFGANATSGVGAAGQVAFTYAYRCFTSVSECDTYHDAAHWPDSPWDQYCWPGGSSCPGVTAPVFWHAGRITRLESRAWDYVTGSWAVTDQLNLGHIFPGTGDYVAPAGDDTPPSLWLDSLWRQNNEQVLVANGPRMANRVFWGDDLSRSPMMHYRIGNLFWGSGGVTSVTYSGEECTRTNVYDGRADHNVLKCFPQWEDDQFRWYHKYVVTQVSNQDMAVSYNPPVVTRYTYQGGATSPQGQEYADAMWRFDDNWLTPMSRRTYSKWRGYSLVYTYTGAADGTGLQKQAQDIYFRGMNGDRSGDTIGGIGGTWGARQVNISDGSTTYADHEGMPGKLLRHAEYDATTGVWRNMSITNYEVLAAGTMSTNGGEPPAFNAWRVLPNQNRTLLYGTGGTLMRTSTVNTTYDSTYPLVTYVADLGETQSNLNPVGNTDDKCIGTNYVPADTTRWLIGFPKETMAINCTVSPPTSASYLAGQRFYYDGQAHGVLGAGAGMGKMTKTEALKSVSGSITRGFVFTWETRSQNTVYDSYGRATTSLDAAGRTTTTSYLPAANVQGAVKTVFATTTGTGGVSLGTTTTNLDPRFGSPISVTDVNSKVTRAEYDWHGYLTKVWKNHRTPNLADTTTITPDAEYRYVIRGDKPSYVGTKLLAPNGSSQLTESISYVDGLMRPRRTETPSADSNGRAVTDIWYGAAGQTTRTLSVWLAGAPNGNWDGWDASAAYQDVQYGYNGLGEQTSVTPYSQGVALGSGWNTTTVTDGRTTTVTPPSGGTVTTTVTNAHGKTAELRQAKPGGGTLNTVYTYDRLGQLSTVKDPANNTWTYIYDRLGRKTGTTDPDAGTSSTTYTVDGLTESTTDARGQQLWNEYDGLGRTTKLHADTASGTVVSEWSYDTAVFTGTATAAKGQPASTTRKDAAGDYKTEILSYNNAYKAEQTRFTAPAFGAGGGTLVYTTTASFNPNGTPATTAVPAAGGLQNETLTYGYNGAGIPNTTTSTLGSTSSPLIASTVYWYDGKIASQYLGAAGKQVKNSNTWELATNRLLTATTATEDTPGSFGSKLVKGYTHDPAGNITSTSNDNPGTSTDNKECFAYDTLRRLTQAWTLTLAGTCGTPQKAGPDPYWRTWAVDDLGNRTSEVDKNTDGTPANTWTYTNGAAGSVKPHQVKTITPTTGSVRSFAYDNAGNVTTRTTDTGLAQTLTWDKENHLATVTGGGNTSSYIYNTDGSRLLAVNTVAGVTKTTLYLPDGTELEKTSTGAISGQRYVGGVGVRDITGLKWTITNHQGTPLAQVNASDLTISARQMMPYGQPRGTQPSWLGSKGYVGGTTDTPTGLTHLGAREYDPGTGRFISVDPIMDLSDPQQWNAYTYSNNSPITWSDPSGLHNGSSDLGGGDGCVSALSFCNKGSHGIIVKATTGSPVGDGVMDWGYENTIGAVIGLGDWAKATWNNSVELGRQLNSGEIGLGDFIWEHAKGLCHTPGIACSAGDVVAAIENGIDRTVDAIQAGDSDTAIYEGTKTTLDIASIIWGVKAAKGPKGCNSFEPNTLVLLADGTTAKISDIQLGDLVLATDPESGETEAKEVTALIVGEGLKDLVEIKIQTSDGDGTITATAGHPFWIQESQVWLAAADLGAGMDLLTADGSTVEVLDVQARTEWRKVNNLTVDDIHTYYVLADNTPVLVHNDGGEGYVYLRVDTVTGDQYVGQAINDERYIARQVEHQKKFPNAKFEFHVLGRAPAGTLLDRLEESWIRAGGGPKTKSNPDGTLVNKRFQMNDIRYLAAGGDVCR